MPTITTNFKFSIPPTHSPSSIRSLYSPISPSILTKFPIRTQFFSSISVSQKTFFTPKSSSEEYAEVSESEEEWLQKLPDKKKALYSHSLPCIEAWLKTKGFHQSKEDRAVWFVENKEWNAQLSLDVTDIYIRYMKSGPGNLEKDVERRFSYALSREDIENAILGGP